MILSMILTAALVSAAPPSPRAVAERQQTLWHRHVHRLQAHEARLDREAESAREVDFGPILIPYPVWYGWPVYYPPTAGQLPPHWDDAYGGFLSRMGEATR